MDRSYYLLAWAVSLSLLCPSSSERMAVRQAVLMQLDLPNFLDEVHQPKYRVLSSTKSMTEQEQLAMGHRETVRLKNPEGDQLLCFLPDEASVSSSQSMTYPQEAQESPAVKLTSSLHSTCIFQVGDWWTYELCMGVSVRQYHVHGEQVQQEFSLGKYNPEQRADQVHHDSSDLGARPYLREVYENGSDCDVALRRRSTEVWYVCPKKPLDSGLPVLIESVSETQSCGYRIVVSAPELCTHPAFHSKEVPVADIECFPSRDLNSVESESGEEAELVEERLEVFDVFGKDEIPTAEEVQEALRRSQESKASSPPARMYVQDLSNKELLTLMQDVDENLLEEISEHLEGAHIVEMDPDADFLEDSSTAEDVPSDEETEETPVEI